MDHIGSVMRQRRQEAPLKVIAEVNEKHALYQRPAEHFIAEKEIDVSFKSNARLAGPTHVEISEVEKNIWSLRSATH